jgi:hypothetical protein
VEQALAIIALCSEAEEGSQGSEHSLRLWLALGIFMRAETLAPMSSSCWAKGFVRRRTMPHDAPFIMPAIKHINKPLVLTLHPGL